MALVIHSLLPVSPKDGPWGWHPDTGVQSSCAEHTACLGQPHSAHASSSPGRRHASTNTSGITEVVKILSSRSCASSDGLSRDAGPGEAGSGAAWRQSTISSRPAAPQSSQPWHMGTSGAIAKAFPALQPISAWGGSQGEGTTGYQRVPTVSRDLGPHSYTPAGGQPGQFSQGSAASRWSAASSPHEMEGRQGAA